MHCNLGIAKQLMLHVSANVNDRLISLFLSILPEGKKHFFHDYNSHPFHLFDMDYYNKTHKFKRIISHISETQKYESTP